MDETKLIPYTLQISSKARRVRLAVYADGRMVLTVPRSIRKGFAESFLKSKRNWVLKRLEYFKNHPEPVSKVDTKKEYAEYKQAALVLAKDRVAEYNDHYNFKVGTVSVKNTKTRWGSCSKKGNLSFNYKIALLPEKLQNYLVVHELCHIAEFNHSKKFWDLVSETIPEWKNLRKELKSHERTK